MSAADEATPAPRPGKRASAFRTIGEVAEDLDVPAHVLRFWESKFPQLKPMKRGGGRRYYRPEDVALVQRIRRCLYQEGYTIRGVQRLLNGGMDKTDAVLPPHGLPETATLFPLDPLPPQPAVEGKRSRPPAAKQARAPAVCGLPEEVRTALEDLRRDLVEIRELAERLRRGA